MPAVHMIVPCLWFDNQAEEAVAFYTSLFPNSRIVRVTRYGETSYELHRERAGSVMTIAFELAGQSFTALNGGPVFSFNEAISLQVHCQTQAEVDHFWERLGAGGDEQAQQCGWLKDRYGVSWQIIPTALLDMINDSDSAKVQRVTEVMLQMKKLDLDQLQQAYNT